MEIQTKTPASIESQIGAFLLSDFPPGTLSYPGMGNAVGEFVEAKADSQKTKELIEEINPRASRGDKQAVYRQYASFMKHLSPEKRAEIKHIATLFEAYQPFKDSVTEIIDQPNNIIGHGGFSRVHPLQFDGESYAVRVPYLHSRVAMDEVHKHLEAALLTRDLPHIEHIVAASYADGVTVAELAPGKNLKELSPNDMRAVTEAQIEDIFTAMTAAHERGIGFDLLGDNIMYDPNKGFTAIDVSLAEANNPMSSSPAICLIETIRRCNNPERSPAKTAAVRVVLQKLEAVMKKHLPNDADAFTQIGRRIDELQ